ncbi:MAG: hypothetical protein ACOCX4_06290 [Planctomycetota bacterium]
MIEPSAPRPTVRRASSPGALGGMLLVGMLVGGALWAWVGSSGTAGPSGTTAAPEAHAPETQVGQDGTATDAAEPQEAMGDLRDALFRAERDQMVMQKREARLLRYGEHLAARLRAQSETLRRQRDFVWETVLRDDFDREALGDHYVVASGSWDVKQGMLRTLNNASDHFLVCKGVDMRGDVRIRYRARTLSCYNGDACDLSLALGVRPDAGARAMENLLFRFGSFDNQRTGLSQAGGPGLFRHDMRIVPQQWHEVTVQRLGRALSMFVDGKPVFLLEQEEGQRLNGGGPQAAGFYIYKSTVEIDWMEVSKPRRLVEEIPERYVRLPALELPAPPRADNPQAPPAPPFPLEGDDRPPGEDLEIF